MFSRQTIIPIYAQAEDGSTANGLDVLIPAYRGLPETRQCIESVLSSRQKKTFELIVVDDASPEPELVAYLDKLAASGAVTLLRNQRNLGFVQSVNRGMSLHSRRDVVLLNSDTVVANDWLDRIHRCAYSAQDIGTVTPFSNNATICSYPVFCAENALPPGIALNDLDRIFSRVNHGKSVVIPTAVGFCMFIRRACLDQVGLFDAEKFGKGYGEENDFSRRAVRSGWQNVLCADTFVQHLGGVSFLSERGQHQAKAVKALRQLHPDYDELVQRFISADPIRELRQAVDRELIKSPAGPRNSEEIKEKKMLAKRERNNAVCVFAEADTLPLLGHTIRSLASNSVLSSRIIVVAPAESMPRLETDGEFAGGAIPVEFVAADDFWNALAAQFKRGDDAGIFLVSPGTTVPFAWDARLAKVAQADPMVASVSPFCDASPAFALFDALPARQLSAQDACRVDRLLYCLGRHAYFEITAALRDCCYLSRHAVETLLAAPKRSRPQRDGWSRYLSEKGLVHAISDSVYVSRQADTVGFDKPVVDRTSVDPLLAQIRKEVADAFDAGTDFKALPGLDGRPVQLHIVHDLGGGAIQWVRDFSRGDNERINLVLKPYSRSHAFGEGLALYSHVDDTTPMMFWQFATPIQATAASHPEYRRAIGEIVSDYCVDSVLVSSLVGHSLDVLETGLPTVVVGHDYFPYCPAINIYNGGVCESCSSERLADCHKNNLDFNPFLSFPVADRLLVRKRFLTLLEARNITMVVPTREVQNNLVRLESRFGKVRFELVPHGSSSHFGPLNLPASSSQEKLRILVLGQLSVGKGSSLLLSSLEQITRFAEVFLIGCGELTELFRNMAGVHPVSAYQLDELPIILRHISPDLGLLLSIVPETFSYTLSELIQFGIPVAATRVGSFKERIKHGETGYLFEPNTEALLETLRSIAANRSALADIKLNLLSLPDQSVETMVADYHRILPLQSGAYARYPLNRNLVSRSDMTRPDRDETRISQALMLSDMWKEIKKLNLTLVLKEDVIRRGETKETQIKQVLVQRNQELARNVEQVRHKDQQLALKDEQLAEQGQQLVLQDQHLAHQNLQLARQDQQLAQQDQQLSQKDQQLSQKDQQLSQKDQQLEENARQLGARARQLDEKDRMLAYKDGRLSEIYASTSWKISSPVRWVGFGVRKLKILARCLLPLARNPIKAPSVLLKLYRIWRSTGMLALKQNLLRLPETGLNLDDLEKCAQEFSLEIKPAILARIQRMKNRPRISILMPTYNTPEEMLRQTIQSVLAQLYPDWELCIADDGSSQPQVKRVLQEYANADPRIKVHFGETNKGVSHASNMALRLATGTFAVLLDHDDMLEEQAIFRVAECVEADDPDMLYSDEALISGDGSVVIGYALRPAFSPELLRSHPYIVHMVGFRTLLLREIGGFDETLTISQDYDLILRASETAKRIVHIPEILYRWRTYESSAGHQKMRQVMDISKDVLSRHLQRCGEKASVADGPSFNFFDTRYPLQGKTRVAIIIPTKNHGELVRQCIESIEATVRDVPFDIVLVDHASDDAASLAYFETLKARAQVLRYEGPFNFSAINNWAVSRLTGEYSHYLFCNNDIEAIEPGWLERMVELGQQPSVGMVGAKLFYPDRKTIQHAGVCVGAYGAAEHYGKFMRMPDHGLEPGYLGSLIVTREVSAVTAACLLISKQAFDEVDGFDEQLAVGFGDVDLCLKVGAKGYRVLFCPYAQLVHHESFTRGKSTEDPHPQDSAYFLKKWNSLLEEGDPYFNPNLSLFSTAWHVKLPMRPELEIRRRMYQPDHAGARQQVSNSQPVT